MKIRQLNRFTPFNLLTLAGDTIHSIGPAERDRMTELIQ
jgi:hypothetical protein